MYFVMDPPIESDMGPGYCLVGELVYTISHPGVVPSLFEGPDKPSQWPIGLTQEEDRSSSSEFVNILFTVVLWLWSAMPPHCVWATPIDSSCSHLFQILLIVTPSQCHPQLTLLSSGSVLCSRHSGLSLCASHSAVTLVRLHGIATTLKHCIIEIRYTLLWVDTI